MEGTSLKLVSEVLVLWENWNEKTVSIIGREKFGRDGPHSIKGKKENIKLLEDSKELEYLIYRSV